MSNHYHLVFRTRLPNLSLGGQKSEWRRRPVVELVSSPRRPRLPRSFKAEVVEASVYLVRLCRYVLAEPGGRETSAPTRETGLEQLQGALRRGLVRLRRRRVPVATRGHEKQPRRSRAVLDYVEPAAHQRRPPSSSDRRVIGTEAFANSSGIKRVTHRRRKRRPRTACRHAITGGDPRGRHWTPEGLAGGIGTRISPRPLRRRKSSASPGLSRKTVRRMVKGFEDGPPGPVPT